MWSIHRGSPSSPFFRMCRSNFLAPYVEKNYTFFIGLPLPLSKISSLHSCESTSGLCSVPLIYVSILLPILCCLDYCSFIVSFEISVKTPIWSSVSFRIVLPILVTLPSHKTFEMDCRYLPKNCAGIFIEVALTLEINLERIDILTLWVFQAKNVVNSFTYVLSNFFHQCFIVFSIQILNIFY